MSTIYYNKHVCTKCRGVNSFVKPSIDEIGIYETATKCDDCGFEDYWAYGFFQSSSEPTERQIAFENFHNAVVIFTKESVKAFGVCKLLDWLEARLERWTTK